ncbi:NmrA/HSCARG family protein [Natronococcus sp.]|uniref:NmrA/HSCARG family protein n=1 Tax=Natronococcus sp. TaxID=35747 RepID=UPI003A4E61CF
MDRDSVLVVGSTGTQGGAVARHLLEREVDVLALTRDHNSERAHALAEHGAEVVEADIGERNSIEPLVEQADGVFLMTNFWEHGFDDEVDQGRNVVELAADIGTDHLVFSSVGGADRETGIPHFDSKWEIEDGTLAMGLEPHVPLQVLDIEDLGAFVAEVFAEPDRYTGEAFELASDELPLRAMAVRFADALGFDVRARHLSIEDVREGQGEEFAAMFEWFNEAGYESPIDELQADHDVDFNRLEEYLERTW